MSGPTQGPIQYTLAYPVELKNGAGEVTETIAALQLHRLKGRDMRAMDNAKGPGSIVLALIAASARLPPSTVEMMDGADVTAVGEIVADFLGGSLPTGAL